MAQVLYKRLNLLAPLAAASQGQCVRRAVCLPLLDIPWKGFFLPSQRQRPPLDTLCTLSALRLQSSSSLARSKRDRNPCLQFLNAQPRSTHSVGHYDLEVKVRAVPHTTNSPSA